MPYMDGMEQDKDPLVRKSVSLRKSVWDEIEAYKQEEKLGSEAEAVRRLVLDQLKAERRRRGK